ncbi:Hsp70 family protein [Ammoniphilus sp. CFH 90114]|uniref:Hsp70 family protein n=1 Tax=Ammoniphilus sp. CFH 90114 TaxID=2493665 RepID=UPI0013E98AA7|nr:Hsp70 family protein [Ammoniphilus sp. CFH 90114]
MRYVGIDLGTTNSTISVAHLDQDGKHITPVTLDITQLDESGSNISLEKTLPSALFVDEQDQPYIGRYARKMAHFYPQNVIREAKRYMGEEVSWPINEKKYRPETVSSYILKAMKMQAEQYYMGEPVDSVVITVPANFNFQQDKATRVAAELAGFAKDKIHTIPEPTAALLDFLNEEKKLHPDSRKIQFHGQSKNLMVFDLGGGTCDVSILQVKENATGDLDIQELSISQYMELGGLDFDRLVAKYLLEKLCLETGYTIQTLQREFRSEFPQIRESLLSIAEKFKIHFASQINHKLIMQQTDYYENKEQFDQLTFRYTLTSPEKLATIFTMTKKEYDQIVEPLLYAQLSSSVNIEEPILNALSQAKKGEMKKEEIDAVFLVGGMTFYPAVQERIYELFDKRLKPIRSVNPMYAVSRGAAVYHDMVANKREEAATKIGVKNTIQNNVFIRVFKSDSVALLEKGTSLPYERLIEDEFFVTGPHKTVYGMKLDLFTAEDPKSPITKNLKSASITFKEPVEVGAPLILQVKCNEERDVSVKAWLKGKESEVIDVNVGSHVWEQEEKEFHIKNLDKIKFDS